MTADQHGAASMSGQHSPPWADHNGAWAYMFAKITLDRVDALLAPLQIRAANPDDFRRAVRYWVHAYLAAPMDARPDIHQVRRDLVSKLGMAEAEQLRPFLQYDFYAPDAPAFGLWKHTMVDWSRNPQVWARLGLPAAASEAWRRRCHQVDEGFDSLGDLAHALHRQPLSEWDLGIYTLMNLDDDENDPLTVLVGIAFDRGFYCFWRDLDQSLTQAGRLALADRANALASEEGSPSLPLLSSDAWPPC